MAGTAAADGLGTIGGSQINYLSVAFFTADAFEGAVPK